MNHPNRFTISVTTSAGQVGQAAWDALAAGRPFASYRWTRFGEIVMTDCPPSHVTIERDGKPVARATFWRVANEPLPLPPPLRPLLAAFLKRRPLLICRAPLANWTGLLLPDDSSLQREALAAFHQLGLELLKEQRGSFLLFDFLGPESPAWPVDVTVATVSDPGTTIAIRWKTFDEYLAATTSRSRKHYKHSQREAQSSGLVYSTRSTVTNIDKSLALIHMVERKFKSAQNPWTRPLLENVEQIGGICQEVHQRGRLVGCCLLLEDNGVMFATALGLAADVQYAYFLLSYGFVQEAIQRGVKTLRLGSGAYEVKRRLGCELEANNHAAITTHNRLLRRAAYWFT